MHDTLCPSKLLSLPGKTVLISRAAAASAALAIFPSSVCCADMSSSNTGFKLTCMAGEAGSWRRLRWASAQVMCTFRSRSSLSPRVGELLSSLATTAAEERPCHEGCTRMQLGTPSITMGGREAKQRRSANLNPKP